MKEFRQKSIVFPVSPANDFPPIFVSPPKKYLKKENNTLKLYNNLHNNLHLLSKNAKNISTTIINESYSNHSNPLISLVDQNNRFSKFPIINCFQPTKLKVIKNFSALDLEIQNSISEKSKVFNEEFDYDSPIKLKIKKVEEDNINNHVNERILEDIQTQFSSELKNILNRKYTFKGKIQSKNRTEFKRNSLKPSKRLRDPVEGKIYQPSFIECKPISMYVNPYTNFPEIFKDKNLILCIKNENLEKLNLKNRVNI